MREVSKYDRQCAVMAIRRAEDEGECDCPCPLCDKGIITFDRINGELFAQCDNCGFALIGKK